jgi:hypothetical protein
MMVCKKAFNNLNRLQKKRQDQKLIQQRKLEHAQMEDYLVRNTNNKPRKNTAAVPTGLGKMAWEQSNLPMVAMCDRTRKLTAKRLHR